MAAGLDPTPETVAALASEISKALVAAEFEAPAGAELQQAARLLAVWGTVERALSVPLWQSLDLGMATLRRYADAIASIGRPDLIAERHDRSADLIDANIAAAEATIAERRQQAEAAAGNDPLAAECHARAADNHEAELPALRAEAARLRDRSAALRRLIKAAA